MEHLDKKILCIGEVLWDVLGSNRKPGGAPMNVAMHLNRFKHQVHIASRIGKDEAGKELLRFLENAGIDTSHIQVDPELPTSEVLVQLDDFNNASYDIVKPVAWDHMEYNATWELLASQADMIVYGTLASRTEEARNTIHRLLSGGAIKLIDVNLRPPFTQTSIVQELIEKADIAKLNDEELHIIAGWSNVQSKSEQELMMWISEHYKLKSVVVTRGGEGAIIYDNHSFYQHPGYKIKVADTVGAGDAFLAAYISSILNEDLAGDSLNFACATGAYVASQTGATPEYNLEDILSIQSNNSK